MKEIVSRDNAHFKELRKLCQSGRERRKSGRLLLDGMHLVDSYQSRFGSPQEIIVSQSGAARGEIAAYLAHGAGGSAVSMFADALFAELASVDTPSGIMALVAQPRCAQPPGAQVDTVILDGIQDPGNLGSILRSAAAAGFRQLLLSADCAAAWSPKTLRAAMGAHFLVDIHEDCDLPAFLAGYRGQALLTALDATCDLFSLDLTAPVAWVFGDRKSVV